MILKKRYKKSDGKMRDKNVVVFALFIICTLDQIICLQKNTR